MTAAESDGLVVALTDVLAVRVLVSERLRVRVADVDAVSLALTETDAASEAV